MPDFLESLRMENMMMKVEEPVYARPFKGGDSW